MYCMVAASLAEALTTMEYGRAPNFSRVSTSSATELAFWPMAT